VIALLSPVSTPPAARSELKKLLLARNVRKTIADGIIGRIFSISGTAATSTNGADTTSAEVDGANKDAGRRSSAATPALEDVDVVYVCVTHIQS